MVERLLGVDSRVIPAADRLVPGLPEHQNVGIVYRVRITGGRLRPEANGEVAESVWTPIPGVAFLRRSSLVDIGLGPGPDRPGDRPRRSRSGRRPDPALRHANVDAAPSTVCLVACAVVWSAVIGPETVDLEELLPTHVDPAEPGAQLGFSLDRCVGEHSNGSEPVRRCESGVVLVPVLVDVQVAKPFVEAVRLIPGVGAIAVAPATPPRRISGTGNEYSACSTPGCQRHGYSHA